MLLAIWPDLVSPCQTLFHIAKTILLLFIVVYWEGCSGLSSGLSSNSGSLLAVLGRLSGVPRG